MSAPFPPRSIVVATDFSEGGDEALAYAVALAARLDAVLHVVHTVPRLSEVALALPESGYFQTPEWSRAIEELRDTARASLAERIEGLAGPVEIRTAVLEGEPADSVTRYAAEEHAQMIVVGTHGRRGLRRALVGSVAERTVRLASVPVVVVR